MDEVKKYLEDINTILDSYDPADLKKVSDAETIERYYECIKIFYNYAFVRLIKLDLVPQKALVTELCTINSLYSIQLKLHHELPDEMEELAYDFDNPDYPGLAYILDKIKNKKYLIQR